MNLERLKRIFADQGCKKVYVKTLAKNDDSKHQPYLGGDEIFNLFPTSEIKAISSESWDRERFIATIDFAWIAEDGALFQAPNTKFILYPKYPEVRLSGFLRGCSNGPSRVMNTPLYGRLLFLSVSTAGRILGYAAFPDSQIAAELRAINTQQEGVFATFNLSNSDNRTILLNELARIHRLDWITSKRLDRLGNIMACDAPNCGGYTLEAELGITPNGYSEPDFLGWELKQFGVDNFNRIGSAVITLMTPEPTEGLYVSQGVDYFIRTYGYPDQNNRPDRLNFGGIHKAGVRHERTRLTMELIGFDGVTGKIRSSTGRIVLVDEQGNEAAAWSFASMLKHWNRKHNQACYVPSLSANQPVRQYHYGNLVTLGVDTDFQLFLQQMFIGNIYYDPGIKMENVSTRPTVKRRSQFRIKSSFLGNLYKSSEVVDVTHC
ncbi:MvaI/BcnI restriction endonuclease family protein (plasmid) [Spirosoma taeanense]|uniref:MvaI/BcnI restriction endonuclease family protein n=1 Tax=Spirosoma taeanense TaxID=2735870 RepID=A0A6M5YHN9_9BACT|nr:MvaI/BcnI family restriction endonuclease [Spirosoma taeanense]QJW92472.1 MvaI/BcnI restriction endonuclease family protein [Spirosoma taeanense]